MAFLCWLLPTHAFAERPDLSQLTPEERQSIESACSYDKLMNGPAAYNECLRKQLAALNEPSRDSITPPTYKPTPTVPEPTPKKPRYPKEVLSAPIFNWPAWRDGISEGRPKPLPAKPLDSVSLFKSAAPSVYVVIAGPSKRHLLDGNNVAQGSAVAVSKSRLITNCHVVEGRSFITIIQREIHKEKMFGFHQHCI